MTPEQEGHFEEYKRLHLDREMTFDSYLLNFAGQDRSEATRRSSPPHSRSAVVKALLETP